MTNKQTGGPAFSTGNDYEKGMTLRDYFAAKAMQGLLACSEADGTNDDFARWAYKYADAMLKARDGAADKPADPCPGCCPGVTCRTPSCGRLKFPGVF